MFKVEIDEYDKKNNADKGIFLLFINVNEQIFTFVWVV